MKPQFGDAILWALWHEAYLLTASMLTEKELNDYWRGELKMSENDKRLNNIRGQDDYCAAIEVATMDRYIALA